MGAGGADHTGDVQGRDGDGVDSVDEDGTHSKREGEIQRHRDSRDDV